MADLPTKKTLEQLNTMQTGQLILSDDWNDLVNHLININAGLSAGLAAAVADITQLKTDLVGLRHDFETYAARVAPVIDQFYRVDIKADQALYTIGQVAVVEVQVADPLGGPLVRAADRGRPWVDFVATWGQLKAMPGFESVSGDGDRAVSVRANEQGIARVRLVADHAAGVAETDETAVSAALATKVAASNKPVAQMLLESEAPMEVKNNGVFQLLTKEYERTDTPAMRNYVDTYVARKGAATVGKYVPRPGYWQDHHATVLAFVKSDNDPASADTRHGSESILITFRDWIRYWIDLEYLDPDQIKVAAKDLGATLAGKVQKADYAKTATAWQAEIADRVSDPGLVAQMRKGLAMDYALDTFSVPDAPEYLPTLVDAMRQGVRMQTALATSQASAAADTGQNVPFQVITTAATRADTNVSGVYTQIGTLQQQLGDVNTRVQAVQTQVEPLKDLKPADLTQQLTNLQTQLTVVNTQVNDLKGPGGPIVKLRGDVDTVQERVAGFQDLNPTDIRNALGQLSGIQTKVDGTIGRLQVVETRVLK